MRREKAAVPVTKVNNLEVFIKTLSSSSARSLKGSWGGFVHGFGRYLHRIIHIQQ